MNKTLRDKFYGCIAGSQIASSMGAVVEGWSYTDIEKEHGTFASLQPYEHYNNGWLREAGTTEDGIERQKMLITAIIEKKDRINAEDFKAIWVRDMNPLAPCNVSEPFEAALLAMAKAGLPARDIGKYCDYANLCSFSRACHPIGLINAGDEKAAAEDVMEVGQLYQSSNSRGLKWACVTAVAIAAATKPSATVDSVLQSIFDTCTAKKGDRGDWYASYAGVEVAQEIQTALDKTKHCKNFRELRAVFDGMYMAYGIPYSQSFANEVVTKAVCIFKMVGGDVKDAIIAAVNMGRDTDCCAAVAAGISGALSGADPLPKEWIEQVDYAVTLNPYTNSKRTLKESADGMYNAYISRYEKAMATAKMMGI
jgi:ADP-ribosylglycohydrolase